MDNIFENFVWHSAIGIDFSLDGSKKFVTKVANTPGARSMFIVAGENLLIHKTTKALWRFSENNDSIVPVFSSDVLTEDEVCEAMEESGNELG